MPGHWPLLPSEVRRLLERLAPKPHREPPAACGDTVRIVSGPFSGFHGRVERVDARKQSLEVSLSIIDREARVELDFGQVARE